MTKLLWRWGPALLMMTLIFLASDTPGYDLPKLDIWDAVIKKGGHMLGYGLLAATFAHGLAFSTRMRRSTVLLAIILAGLYAVTDEFHQSFTPERTPSIVDVGIDTFGAALGGSVWAWIRKYRRS
jgi:VanZ family protein